MKYPLLPLIALLAFTQLACTQFSGAASPRGINASDDELLRTLASLAKRGSDAVCNPAIVEKELGIKLGEFKIDKTPSLAGEPREGQITDAITSALSGKSFSVARYYRGRDESGSGCGVIINFQVERFCHLTSQSVEKIMGVSATVGPARTHRTGFVYFYRYASSANDTFSEVWIGDSTSNCSSGFRLTTNGEWK